ncbi:hypothetical protein [Leptospira noguchii]|uniref:hypothetical protein n=1 Tax=Leptospira noguchii TaxID=28182 RepID=UPI003B968189
MSLKNSEGIEAKRTQHNAFLWVALTQRLASIGARQVVSHFNYEICELRRTTHREFVALSLLFAPIFLRRTHVRLVCFLNVRQFEV